MSILEAVTGEKDWPISQDLGSLPRKHDILWCQTTLYGCHKQKIYLNKHMTSGDQDGHQSVLSGGGCFVALTQANMRVESWFVRDLSISMIGVKDNVQK